MTNKTCTIVVAPGLVGEDEGAKIAKAYGCFKWLDGWDGNALGIQPGHLLVTTKEGFLRPDALNGLSFDFPVRVVTYKVAIEMVKIDEEGRA